MNTSGIAAAFLLFFLAAAASAEAQTGAEGTEAKGVLFDGNAPSHARLSGWHESMGKAVVDARPIALNLRALQLPDLERIPAEKVPADTVLVGQTVDVILPGQGKPVTLKVEKVEQIVDGVVTYSGVLEADPEAFFSFSVRKDWRGIDWVFFRGNLSTILQPVRSHYRAIHLSWGI